LQTGQSIAFLPSTVSAIAAAPVKVKIANISGNIALLEADLLTANVPLRILSLGCNITVICPAGQDSKYLYLTPQMAPAIIISLLYKLF